VSKLLGFDFRVEYKPGATNITMNALSRQDTKAQALALALFSPSLKLFDDLMGTFTSVTDPVALCQEVETGARDDKWVMVDGLVTCNGHDFIPASLLLIAELLASAHGDGHEGTQKTLHWVCTDFFIPGARNLVRDFVRACSVCQRNKTKHLHPAGLL
jgi:hypothetical protein